MAQKIACGGFEIGDGLELNGKVLSASGGGQGGMVVNVTINMEDMSATADKTIAQIADAVQNGLNVIAMADVGGVVTALPFGTMGIESDKTSVAFGAIGVTATGILTYFLSGETGEDADEWTLTFG